MKRILLVMSVAALMAAILVVTAVPAFATIHQLSEAQCAASPVDSNDDPLAANTTLQDPPGISPDGADSVGTDDSQASAPTAQPLKAIRAQDGAEVSTAEQNAFKDEVCPAVQP